jgi:hypothetical protein
VRRAIPWRQRIVFHLPQLRIDDKRVRHEEHGITIGLGTRYSFRCNDPARPRAVLDHHSHALRPTDLFGQQTGREIGYAARRRRGDDLDCSRGLRPCAVAEQEDAVKGGGDPSCQMQKSMSLNLHWNPSSTMDTERTSEDQCPTSLLASNTLDF